MTKEEIIDKLISIKPKLEKEGFIIYGIFGSYARGDYTNSSDIDIFYSLKDPHKFTQINGGFGAFSKIREVKDFLVDEFAKDVDFVDRSSLSRTGEKYILGELVYV